MFFNFEKRANFSGNPLYGVQVFTSPINISWDDQARIMKHPVKGCILHQEWSSAQIGAIFRLFRNIWQDKTGLPTNQPSDWTTDGRTWGAWNVVYLEQPWQWTGRGQRGPGSEDRMPGRPPRSRCLGWRRPARRSPTCTLLTPVRTRETDRVRPK